MQRSLATAFGVISLIWSAQTRTPSADLSALLDRSSAYVTALEKQLEAIIWHEQYRQEDRVPRRFSTSGSSFVRSDQRHLEGEMLFLWVEASATWMAVRDVMTVDGKPVVRRLPQLLQRNEVKLRDLTALSRENGRYNIGAIDRNFNEPMLALLFLDPRYRTRFTFADAGSDEVAGTPVRRIRFTEVRKPTLIRSINRDVESTGFVFVEPSTGRVLRTSLDIEQRWIGIHGRVVVSYGMSEKLGVMVPLEMQESYGFDGTRDDEGITCTATYSDFRRFETGGRLVFR